MVDPTSPRSDQQIHRESVQFADHEIVRKLRELLGLRVVAFLGSVKETRAVRQWADAERKPSTEVMNRLRSTYITANILHEHHPASVVQAWFMTMNPQLDDVAPALVLRESPSEVAGPDVLAAARSFLAC